MANTTAEEYRNRAEDYRSRAIRADTLRDQAFWIDLANRLEQSANKLEELASSGLLSAQSEKLAA